jgi:osmotically-inducible protein OsmY
MVSLPTNLTSSVKALAGAILGGLIWLATSAGAQNLSAPAAVRLGPTVVTTKKPSDAVADEKVRDQVETALHSDPYVDDEHVTVTIKDGVVTLEGMVFDDWDMRQAVRISKRVAGVKRVINELEINTREE